MKVTQCDRCKKIIDNSNKVTVKDGQKQIQISREYDLCPACSRGLERFLEGEALEGGESDE